MRLLILLVLFVLPFPLAAQPAKIKFIVGSELSTQMTSVTDIHVITTDGPYNFDEIRTISFWNEAPDTAAVSLLRYNGIGIYLKNKYLKPLSEKSVTAWEAEVKGRPDTTFRKDTIRIERSGFGTRYWKGSVRLDQRTLFALIQSDPASYAEASLAKSNYNAAQVVGFVSGLLIGWPIGTALGGGDPEWSLAAGGVGLLILVGIPLGNRSHKHMRNAIEIYNAHTKSAKLGGTSIRLVPSLTGATLYVRF